MLGRGKMGPSQSEDEAAMEPEWRHDAPKKKERRSHYKPKLSQVENKMGPSRSEDEAKMVPRLELNRRCKTAGVPKHIVKHTFVPFAGAVS